MKELQRPNDALMEQRRDLGNNNNKNGYFVAGDGNSYEPYSMAWRYLGLFIDCSNNNNNKNRNLGNNGNNNGGSSCQRRLLWAAYHDEHYKGGSIGEYSMFDRERDAWEMRSCRGQTFWPFTRCKQMDCHERRTSWKLVGVYKEKDGLADWAEQLFKHHGYCLWGADQQKSDGNKDKGGRDNEASSSSSSNDYEFMEANRETWSAECQQLKDIADADGNSLYIGAKPLRKGDMTMGIYTDASCLVESKMRYADYLKATGGDDASALNWQSSVDRWNDLLSDYKVCQPCRAYSLSRSNDKGNDGDDGDGGAEQWGFNCYDNAGYRNCNQCYKFATKTDMEEASIADLQAASTQGTILAISVDGATYGSGHVHGAQHSLHVFQKSSFGVLVAGSFVGIAIVYYKYTAFLRRRRLRNEALKEKLTVKTHQTDSSSSSSDGSCDNSQSRRRQKRSQQARNSGSDRGDVDSTQNLVVQIQAKDARLELQAKQIEAMQRELEWYREQAKDSFPYVDQSETL